MSSTIVLIGPPHVGKSTIGKELAAHLGVPFTDLGRGSERYYDEQRYDRKAARAAWETEGMAGYLRYQAPFDAYAVERGLQEHQGVIELSAFQVAFMDAALFARVQQALQPYARVILLLPHPEPEQAIAILDTRAQVLYDGLEINEHFVRHPSNHALAKQRVYTKDQSPAASCEAILQQIDPTAPLVILIGPIGTGKSTLGKLLAERLDRPQVSLDQIRWDYYKEIGYDEAVQREIGEREGFAGVYRYWKRFEAHAVARALQDHQTCVLDFGAGHSVYEDETLFAQVQGLLAPQPNIVLILPSPNVEESVAILKARNTPKIENVPITRYLVTHPAFRTLATQILYTQGQTPAESCAEILASATR